jgi:hypothetical protein
MEVIRVVMEEGLEEEDLVNLIFLKELLILMTKEGRNCLL